MSARLVALFIGMLVVPMAVLVGIGAWEVRSSLADMDEDSAANFVCTKAGQQLTAQMAKEIGDVVRDDYQVSLSSYMRGCDNSGVGGMYTFPVEPGGFWGPDLDAVLEEFKCLGVSDADAAYNEKNEQYRCEARAGQFHLDADDVTGEIYFWPVGPEAD